MPHPMDKQARKAHGDKLNKVAGKSAEYPAARAARIAAVPNKQGDAARMNEEIWAPAAARQVSNYGRVKGD